MSSVAGCTFDTGTPNFLVDADSNAVPDAAVSIDGAAVPVDAAPLDAAPLDAAPPDAAPPDAAPDAAPPDAAPPDAAPPDAAPDAGVLIEPTPETDVLYALRSNSIVVDGDLSEWQDYGWLTITSPDDYVTLSGSAGDSADLSTRIAARWSTSALYIAMEVTDDTHVNNSTGELIYEGDSTQVAFDILSNGGNAYDTTDDFEFGWAIATGGGLQSYRWRAPSLSGAYIAAPYAIVRSGNITTYEVSLLATDFGLVSFPLVEADVGFSMLTNDNDTGSREGYVEWTTGIGQGKNPSAFGVLRLIPKGPTVVSDVAL